MIEKLDKLWQARQIALALRPMLTADGRIIYPLVPERYKMNTQKRYDARHCVEYNERTFRGLFCWLIGHKFNTEVTVYTGHLFRRRIVYKLCDHCPCGKVIENREVGPEGL